MTLAQIRKALVAGFTALASALATTWLQAGHFPGWPAVGAAVGFGVAAGIATWRVPNARPLPLSARPTARHMADQRAMARGAGQKPAAVTNIPPRQSVAPSPPWPSGS